jgi:hypothetical protein
MDVRHAQIQYAMRLRNRAKTTPVTPIRTAL